MSTVTNEEASAKRKLSISASTEEQNFKKVKKDSSTPRGETDHAQHEGVVTSELEDKRIETSVPSVPDSATFLIWAEELITLVEHFEIGEPELYLKSDLLALWPDLKPLTEEERIEQKIAKGRIDHWHLDIPYESEATKRPEARKIQDLFDAEFTKATDVEDSDKKNPEYTDWWEVTMQREKPAEGVPTLEIDFSRCTPQEGVIEAYAGRWWLTGFIAADGETLDAVVAVRDCIGSVHF